MCIVGYHFSFYFFSVKVACTFCLPLCMTQLFLFIRPFLCLFFFLFMPRTNVGWHIKIAPSVRLSVRYNLCISNNSKIDKGNFIIFQGSDRNSCLCGWLVGCFGFNGPLRQYCSLYRAVSQREGEGSEK